MGTPEHLLLVRLAFPVEYAGLPIYIVWSLFRGIALIPLDAGETLKKGGGIH